MSYVNNTLLNPKESDDSKPPGISSVNRAGATQLWRQRGCGGTRRSAVPFREDAQIYCITHVMSMPCPCLSLMPVAGAWNLHRSLGFWLTQVVLQPHFMDNRHVQHWQQTQVTTWNARVKDNQRITKQGRAMLGQKCESLCWNESSCLSTLD